MSSVDCRAGRSFLWQRRLEEQQPQKALQASAGIADCRAVLHSVRPANPLQISCGIPARAMW